MTKQKFISGQYIYITTKDYHPKDSNEEQISESMSYKNQNILNITW